jgi:hypothetical protein
MKNNQLHCLALAGALVVAGCGGAGTESASGGASLQHADATVVTAADYTTPVQQLYIAYFGRPADPNGLTNFKAALASANAPADIQLLVAAYGVNPTVKALVDAFGTSAESNSLYGGDTTGFVTAVYRNVLGRDPDAKGLEFWKVAIDSNGLSKGNAALSIMAGALKNTEPQGLLDAEVVKKKIALGTSFTASLTTEAQIKSYRGDAPAAIARAMLASVSSSTDAASFGASIGNTVSALASSVDTMFDVTTRVTEVSIPPQRQVTHPCQANSALTCTSTIYCSMEGDEVGTTSQERLRIALNALSGTSRIYESDDASFSGTYAAATGAVGFDVTYPWEDVTPPVNPGYAGRTTFQSGGNTKITAMFNPVTRTISGTITDTVITSWSLDSQPAVCTSKLIFTAAQVN